MKIDVLCHDGSPLGVVEEDVYGLIPPRLGIGGAELALMTLCAAWQKAGHDITLYNDPREIKRSSFRQERIEAFNRKEDRDILIIFRSPNMKARAAKGKKVWFSTDQMTVGNFREFSTMVDKIVTISDCHAKYFENMYGIFNSVTIDLPVRTWDYDGKDIQKVPHRCIFTSMPDRGLMPLHAAWPLIVREVPDASLVITSDWRLWADWANESNIQTYRLSFARHPNVIYRGAIKRPELIAEQLRAQVLSYPCQYQELFCIAAAEAQVAGAIPVTSDAGALETTNMGIIIPGNPADPKWVEQFVENVVQTLEDKSLPERQKELSEKARKRFSIERILEHWNERVFNG